MILPRSFFCPDSWVQDMMTLLSIGLTVDELEDAFQVNVQSSCVTMSYAYVGHTDLKQRLYAQNRSATVEEQIGTPC